MTAKTTAKLLSLFALAALVVLGGFTAPATGRAETVRFIGGQLRIVKGNEATVTIAVDPINARCTLAVVYGTRQKGLPAVTAHSAVATWTFTVPRNVKSGRARVTATCARAGRVTRTLTVIGGVVAAKIRIVKSGYSVRNYPFGGSGVSYGVILANDSPSQDALDVTVLVNFVMDDNRLIGSATTHVAGIAAGTQHAMGGEQSFPGGAPIARLEIVAEVGRRGPATRTKPGISQVRVMPSIFEPQWCGSVEGEVQNDSASRTLQSVELSSVILDADGNVIGGGNGFGFAQLPPAARMFFKIENGMRPIPLYKAATALVSVVPTYK